jgi:hypothetical protein
VAARPRSLLHPHRLGRALAWFALAGVLATAASAAAATPMHFTLEDVRGARVPVGAPEQQRTTIVIFMSRRCKDASNTFARVVDEKLLDGPVELVGIVDVHRYGGILKRVALSYMRKSAEEARVHRRQRRVARGVDASDRYVDRWHLIGDFDGALFARFGVAPEPAQPLAFVVDRSGAVHGPYRDVPSLLAAAAQTGVVAVAP